MSEGQKPAYIKIWEKYSWFDDEETIISFYLNSNQTRLKRIEKRRKNSFLLPKDLERKEEVFKKVNEKKLSDRPDLDERRWIFSKPKWRTEESASGEYEIYRIERDILLPEMYLVMRPSRRIRILNGTQIWVEGEVIGYYSK